MVAFLFSGCDLFDRNDNILPPPSSGVESPASGDNGSSAASISRDQALDIALREAGVSKDAVYDLEAELERGFGKSVWEIDFESGNKEYSFDIDAVSGEVILRDIERRD
jgi:uncharacterized membrane protein YkoI